MCSSTISSNLCLCGSLSTASRSSTTFHVRALSMTVICNPQGVYGAECTHGVPTQLGQEFLGVERAGGQPETGVFRTQPLQELVHGRRHAHSTPEHGDLAVEII